MKIKLGVITTETHLTYLKKIENQFENKCKMEFFVAQSLEEVIELYSKYSNSVDGFLVSGPFLYISILNELPNIDKPIYTLNIDKTCVYKQLLKLFIDYPNINSSRIYIDFTFDRSFYLELKELFPEDKMPYLIPIESKNVKEITNTVMNNHLTLWKENKIDLSITAFGHILHHLKNNGIPYIFIYPTEKYVAEIFAKAINEITLEKLKNNKPVVAHISLENSSVDHNGHPEIELKFLSLQKAIVEFYQKYQYEFTVQKKEAYIEIYTTFEDFNQITNNLQYCSLQAYLDKALKFNFKIGWGSGTVLSQAKLNAVKANNTAYNIKESCSYYIDEEQRVVGPLKDAEAIEYSEKANSSILQLADNLSINNINLQKIISYAKKVGTNKLTSEDAAQCLSMTVRGANRLLNKIEEKGFASIVFEKRESLKGRPKKYYELQFLHEDGTLNW